MIVLDTHAWIWWVSDPQKLSNKARAAINYAKQIVICPISCWEIATKVAHEKLELDRDIHVWMHQALARPKLMLVDLSVDITITAGFLGQEGFHGDPADRLIVSTAMHYGVNLITKDKKIRAFKKVQTIW